MKTKPGLCPQRLRQVPRQFSWIDQRLIRDRHIRGRTPQALALYLFLCTVADSQGLLHRAGAPTGTRRNHCPHRHRPPGSHQASRGKSSHKEKAAKPSLKTFLKRDLRPHLSNVRFRNIRCREEKPQGRIGMTKARSSAPGEIPQQKTSPDAEKSGSGATRTENAASPTPVRSCTSRPRKSSSAPTASSKTSASPTKATS